LEEERQSLLELLDDLIQRLNIEYKWFQLLAISSIIMAPISLIFAGFMLAHPNLLYRISKADKFLAHLIVFYIAVNVVASVLWLLVGARESFALRKWTQRFKKYMEIRERVDREIERELERV
jgi:succinate dehydrogenase hydrophobic anchor subunit